VSIALTMNYEDTNDITVKNASGQVRFSEPADSFVSSVAAEITFTEVDPDLFSMMSGNPTVLDATSEAVGFRLSGDVSLQGNWSLEAWTDMGGVACGDSSRPYGYTLLPFLRGGKLGDFTIEDGAASFVLSSATRENAGWGVGPYDVVDTSALVGTVTPGPLLDEIGAKDHLHLQLTTIAPPAETAGLVALAP
jgi:hypothetical protein